MLCKLHKTKKLPPKQESFNEEKLQLEFVSGSQTK